MSFLKELLFAWVQYRHFQRVHAEFERMPDPELRALGLTRKDIAWAAFVEAERRAEKSLATSEAGEGVPRVARARA